MELDRKKLKQQAREAMRAARPGFWVVTLVYFFMTTGLSYLITLLAPGSMITGSIFFTLAMSLYKLVMAFSFDLWSLWTYRELEPGLGSLMQGFSVAGKVIAMRFVVYFWVVLRSVLFTLILIIPPMIILPESMLPLIMVLMVPMVTVVTWVAELYFGLTPFLLADNPEERSEVIVRRSEQLMRGWKWSLCKLELSFAGWYILRWIISAAVTLGVLWLGGFFQALLSFPAEQMPELVSNFTLWTSGYISPTITQSQVDLYNLYYTLANSAQTAMIVQLATLPIFLWLTPYLHVCRAGFYDARMLHQMEQSPEL